jgi:hypothetical protein
MKVGMAIAASRPMIATTIINSIKVNPAWRRDRGHGKDSCITRLRVLAVEIGRPPTYVSARL